MKIDSTVHGVLLPIILLEVEAMVIGRFEIFGKVNKTEKGVGKGQRGAASAWVSLSLRSAIGHMWWVMGGSAVFGGVSMLAPRIVHSVTEQQAVMYS